MAGGDGFMRGRINGWSVNKGRRVCGGGRANQVSTAFGKTQGCVVLVPWFVGCLVGYQCKASIDSIWGKRLVAWFVCCWWATHPFFFTLLPLVGSACLACCLLGCGLLVVCFGYAWFNGCFGGNVGLVALLLGWLVGWLALR